MDLASPAVSGTSVYANWLKGWMTEELWFDFWRGKEIFLYSKASTSAVGSLQSPF